MCSRVKVVLQALWGVCDSLLLLCVAEKVRKRQTLKCRKLVQVWGLLFFRMESTHYSVGSFLMEMANVQAGRFISRADFLKDAKENVI